VAFLNNENAVALDGHLKQVASSPMNCADTGSILWQSSAGQSTGGGIVTYRAGGRQLIGVASGMKSPMWPGGRPAEPHPGVRFALTDARASKVKFLQCFLDRRRDI
jgi:hypothetical protein